MASAGKKQAVILPIDIARFEKRIQLGPKFGLGIFPDGLVFTLQPIRLQREPVRLVSAGFRDEIHFETCLTENIEGMQSLSNDLSKAA